VKTFFKKLCEVVERQLKKVVLEYIVMASTGKRKTMRLKVAEIVMTLERGFMIRELGSS
jgi:hypothetical protein